jgi:hypothetical protein
VVLFLFQVGSRFHLGCRMAPIMHGKYSTDDLECQRRD